MTDQPSAEQATPIEAWQWLGWAIQALRGTQPAGVDCPEYAALSRGAAGIRPDATAIATARAEGYAAGKADVFALVASLEVAEEATYQAMKHGREPHDAYGPAAHEYASQLLEIFIAHNVAP